MKYIITKEISALSAKEAIKKEAHGVILSVIPKPDDFDLSFGFKTNG